jgi:hypothetical protein
MTEPFAINAICVMHINGSTLRRMLRRNPLTNRS